VRIFCLLIFAQTACLAVGLWLESRFVGSVTGTASEGLVSVSPAGEEVVSAERAARPPNGVSGIETSATAMRAMAFLWIAALQAAIAYLILSRLRTEASRKQMVADGESLRRQNDLIRTRNAIIFGLAKLAESRDPETGNHLERIALYSTRLAVALRRHPRYGGRISSTFVKLIGISSALHDIGKVGVRDSVLLKGGALDKSEREAIELHAEIGAKCLMDIELRLGSSNFLQLAREIAFAHHERWDGTGYPRGLAGEDIPLSARIVAVCDVYDALASRRVYKDGLPHEECVGIIRAGAGTQFDPVVVEVFLEIQSELGDITRRCTDPADRQESDGARVPGLPAAAAPRADFDAISTILGDAITSPSHGPSIDVDVLT